MRTVGPGERISQKRAVDTKPAGNRSPSSGIRALQPFYEEGQPPKWKINELLLEFKMYMRMTGLWNENDIVYVDFFRSYLRI